MRNYLTFASILVALIVLVLSVGIEKTGTVMSSQELGVSQAEKRILEPLKLSKPIVFWTRPMFRPSTAYLAPTKLDTFRLWQSEYSSTPPDLVSMKSIAYWIERLKPRLSSDVIEELSRAGQVESCQVNLEEKTLRVFFIPELEMVLITSIERD